jgi:hypothetical protein
LCSATWRCGADSSAFFAGSVADDNDDDDEGASLTLEVGCSSYTSLIAVAVVGGEEPVGADGACPTAIAPVNLNAEVGSDPPSRQPVSTNTLWAGSFAGGVAEPLVP